MRTDTIQNKDWNRNSYNVVKSCHLYEDIDTGETFKVKWETDEAGNQYGFRQHPSLVNRRLRFLGVGTVNVSGFESSKTVPEFSYATLDA